MPEAAQISHVETVADAERLAAFFKSVWRSEEDVVPFDLILAMIHVGGYATMATANSEVVAGSLGFQGEFDGVRVLHSHVTASTRRGAGLALKEHQFAWAKARDLAAITWTFDPLVRRNCVFNFQKLGAVAVEYLPNFYGTMNDQINANDESDRLFAFWSLNSSVKNLNLSDTKTPNIAIKNDDGKPSVIAYDADQAFWVELPEDIEQLRKTDANLAKVWRLAVREVVAAKLNAGWVINAVSADRKAILVEPR
ncbi:MAG: hypothetical protein ACKOWH_00110 [Rhodoluna sp.]